MAELGKKFGRPDLERVGLFSEMPYMIGKKYVSPFPKPNREKGKNLLAGGPKVKDGTQEAYFDKVFKRLFVGEAIRGRPKPKHKPVAKFIAGRPFMPNNPAKKHSSSGDYYGTFSGNIDAFSNKRRKKPPYARPGRNFYPGASKMGGPGYTDICISKYPEHMSDRKKKQKEKVYGQILGRPMVNVHYPQPYFDPNVYKEAENIKPGPTYVRPKNAFKKSPGVFVPNGPAKDQGGCHDGCFDKFPAHVKDPYVSSFQANKPRKPKAGAVFFPQTRGEISFYTEAIVNHNTKFTVNQMTQHDIEPTYIKYLVD